VDQIQVKLSIFWLLAGWAKNTEKEFKGKNHPWIDPRNKCPWVIGLLLGPKKEIQKLLAIRPIIHLKEVTKPRNWKLQKIFERTTGIMKEVFFPVPRFAFGGHLFMGVTCFCRSLAQAWARLKGWKPCRGLWAKEGTSDHYDYFTGKKRVKSQICKLGMGMLFKRGQVGPANFWPPPKKKTNLTFF